MWYLLQTSTHQDKTILLLNANMTEVAIFVRTNKAPQ